MTKAHTRLTKPSARHWRKSTTSGNLDSILRDATAEPGQTNTSNFIDRSFRHWGNVVMTKDEDRDFDEMQRMKQSKHQTLKEMMPDRRNIGDDTSGGSRATHRNKKNNRKPKKTRKKTTRRRR
jgi:hypothetical protein